MNESTVQLAREPALWGVPRIKDTGSCHCRPPPAAWQSPARKGGERFAGGRDDSSGRPHVRASRYSPLCESLTERAKSAILSLQTLARCQGDLCPQSSILGHVESRVTAGDLPYQGSSLGDLGNPGRSQGIEESGSTPGQTEIQDPNLGQIDTLDYSGEHSLEDQQEVQRASCWFFCGCPSAL